MAACSLRLVGAVRFHGTAFDLTILGFEYKKSGTSAKVFSQ
jgi:hypothetical protein